MSKVPSFWRDMLTGKNNQTFDFLRVVGVFGGAVGMFNSVWSTVVNAHPFEASGFFTGLAAWGAGLGIGVRVARPVDADMPGGAPPFSEGDPDVGSNFR